jgi:hypothetical protein
MELPRIGQVTLWPAKPAILTPLRALNAMMLPSPAFTPPIVPLLVWLMAIPQFPLPSGIVPVMSVPILLPWITMPVGLPMMMPSARAFITLAALGVLPPMVVVID